MPEVSQDSRLTEELFRVSHKLQDEDSLTPLLEHVGDARYVLIGEASHGTSEFYSWRARLSKRLIEEKGFSFVAVEGDWPDCYRVNRYVKGYEDAGESAFEVLHAFRRWPTWMWANWEVVAFAEWLRGHNEALPVEARVGFYGLDVYSLWESLEAVSDFLKDTDPDALEAAHRAYRCFEPYREDVHAYAEATLMVPTSCEAEVVKLLGELRTRAETYPVDAETRLNAQQNAFVAVNAERYYRAMIRGGPGSWNVRDTHMMDTLDRLMLRRGVGAKAILWEHNTHIGDARATDMATAGMVNVGQLTRERHSREGVVLVGFGSYQGSVIAGDYWGAEMEEMPVPPAVPGSWEALLHETGLHETGGDRLLISSDLDDPAFLERRGHRAIGVVYHPNRERFGNYVPTVLPKRYDAFLYLDTTEGLHPLHLEAVGKETPDTYPWGL